MCHATYSIDDSKKLCKELQGVKKILIAHKQSMRLLDGILKRKGNNRCHLENQESERKDLLDPSLDPKDIQEKLVPDDNLALFNTVKDMLIPTMSR